MTAISLYNTNYTAFLSTFTFTLINEYSTRKYETSKMRKKHTQRSSRQTKWKWWTEKHTSRLSETIKLRRKMYYVRRKDRKTFGMLIEMDKTTMFDEIESIDHKTRNIINYHNFLGALLSGPMEFIKEKNGFVCAVSPASPAISVHRFLCSRFVQHGERFENRTQTTDSCLLWKTSNFRTSTKSIKLNKVVWKKKTIEKWETSHRTPAPICEFL